MSKTATLDSAPQTARSNRQADRLAERLERGARALADFASRLTDAEWQSRMPHDGRKIGVIVHHVASVYPVEIHLARQLAEGKAITGFTGDDVDAGNAAHAAENEGATREAAIELLRRNSAAAAAAIRELTDEQLRLAAPVSLYGDAPLTCQFVLEDHAVRHSYHHLAKLRRALRK